jgi:oxygen-dependent protoporphyrinogen oxidase
VTVGSTREATTLVADAVVVAVPGPPAARLLAGLDEAAAAAVGALDYASVVLVSLAWPPGTTLPPLSGFLVPATEGFAVKAATFFSTKWPHLAGADRPVLVRASLGRHGDVATLQRPDAELVATVRQELAAILDRALPEPVAEAVTRWGGGLPQYAVGHVERAATARAGLAATVALAGAAYDGVGIAACVRSGEEAAKAVWRGLGQSLA